MGQTLTPDLTASNPSCAVSNDLYTIYTAAQHIEFDDPVYLSSIAITVVGTNITFVPAVDWYYNNTDVALTTLSRLKNIDPTFNEVLVRGIYILSTLPPNYQIACSYQTVYPVQQNIDVATPRLLPEDPNKINTNNVVSDNYPINSFRGHNTIRPVCGAFFADSVVITLPTNPPTLLVRDVDYTIFGLDAARTRSTNNSSGVYTSILITKPYAGIANVSYHAYGGNFTLYDAQAMQNEITTMKNYLNVAEFLTPATLGINPVIESIVTRLLALESRLLAANIA